ncbi:myosin-9-like [Chenopodium quinoa]|uniref:myosin-9-like n=1 Tax=Chenopodium quinoa TaxID=63459 RepID=UPI000B78078B|nr:myosin-9-like [Chenopodium quinoa]XP_021762081.1 myosin-9-like [Chenopodium quinoa]
MFCAAIPAGREDWNLESENQVLRQQAVSMASNKFVSSRQRSMLQDLYSPSKNHRKGEVEEKPQKFLNEKQQENQELLIRCIALPLGFAGNRPIASCLHNIQMPSSLEIV